MYRGQFKTNRNFNSERMKHVSKVGSTGTDVGPSLGPIVCDREARNMNCRISLRIKKVAKSHKPTESTDSLTRHKHS